MKSIIMLALSLVPKLCSSDWNLNPHSFFFFFSFSFFKFYFIFKLYNIVLVFAKYRNESATGIHVFPILNPPPSPFHPSGSSQCIYLLNLLHICWKTQQLSQDWKRSTFIPLPKKGTAKECSNYHTIALISHDSRGMLKARLPVILQGRLQ